MAEEMILFIVAIACSQIKQAELKTLERDVDQTRKQSRRRFRALSYDEAVEDPESSTAAKSSGAAISAARDETILTQQFDRPIMVDRYPSAIKAFYMQLRIRIVRKLPWASTSSRRKATAKSSEAASASMILNSSCAVSMNIIFRVKLLSGTSI